MKGLKQYLLGAFVVASIASTAQTTEAEASLKKVKTDSVSTWKKGALLNLSFSQVSLNNWAAGGNSSVSGNALLNVFSNYIGVKSSWENVLDLGYGLLKQDESAIQKTDDKLEFTSKYGRKASKMWNYAGLVNFKTQFTDGYDYPNDSVKISTFLAPGYLLGAVGMDYKPIPNFGLFLSPVTSKSTFVLDDVLSAAGAFGVDAGSKYRSEFGGYLRANYQKEIMENVNLTTRLDMFSNYVENPQNIDVNWEILILMKVNKYITVSVNTNLIYDDDIKISKDTSGDGINDVNGPRTQFKEVLGVGFSYKL